MREAAVTAKFPPESLARADDLAKRASVALSPRAAARYYRDARWQLPFLPVNLPPHVSRVFGESRMRHADSVNGLSYSPDGLRLACLLCCLGAANALANPKRALRVLPGALYELGVAVVVAISVAPQLIESLQRVRLARRLRADSQRRVHALRGLIIPVVEDAFERSLRLAAAMDSRGYGRNGTATPRSRRITGSLMIVGMLSLVVGVYGLWDGTAPRLLGLPVLAVGSALCAASLAAGSRRVTTTGRCKRSRR